MPYCRPAWRAATAAAGRRQSRYHDHWREEQDQRKYDRMLKFGAALPRLRQAIGEQLSGRGLSRERVLAAALLLVDLGFFRAGGEEYAAEHGTFGLATIRRDHVTIRPDELVFEYPAKGAIRREQRAAGLRDPGRTARRDGGRHQCLPGRAVGRGLHRQGLPDLACERAGRRRLGRPTRAGSDSARKRAVTRVVAEVAAYLGNTPAVGRGSYIDPRVFGRYEDGATIARILGELGASSEFGELAAEGKAEAAVLRLLRAAS